jgi:hypothetical protein
MGKVNIYYDFFLILGVKYLLGEVVYSHNLLCYWSR